MFQKDFYKKIKKNVYVFIAVLFISSTLVWLYFALSDNLKPKNILQAPRTTDVFMHEENLTEEKLVVGDLNLVLITPPRGKIETIFPGTGVSFVFDTDISLYTATVSIKPEIKYALDLSFENARTLVVRPIDDWKPKTQYTITILPGLRSRDGEKMLKKEVVHKIEFVQMSDIYSD